MHFHTYVNTESIRPSAIHEILSYFFNDETISTDLNYLISVIRPVVFIINAQDTNKLTKICFCRANKSEEEHFKVVIKILKRQPAANYLNNVYMH